VREAQRAECRAKTQLGRSALAATLLKRSGETIEWGCGWESGGLEIYDAMLQAMADRAVSSKFPHRVMELLEGYLTEATPLAAKSLEPLKDFPVTEILLREFRHALDRQGQDKKANSFKQLEALANEAATGEHKSLRHYLDRIKQSAQEKLQTVKADSAKWTALRQDEQRRLEVAPVESPVRALIGLCQTVAFIARNLPQPDHAP